MLKKGEGYDPKAAEQHLLEAVRALEIAGGSSEKAAVKIELGRCYLLMERWDEALDAAEAAEEVLPPEDVIQLARAKQLRGEIKSAHGDRDGARAAYQEAIDVLTVHGLHGEAAEVMREVAEGLVKVGDQDGALAVYRELVKVGRSNTNNRSADAPASPGAA
jgi:tetratricopeptide (TPR) repeat protein